MPIAWHNLAQWTLLSAGVALVGCGGQAQSGSSDKGDGVECEYGGKTYVPGDDFPAADGCNSCTCGEDGEVGCTLVDCPSSGCEYGGNTYELYERFPAGDDCNSCICTEVGVTCEMAPCERCQAIQSEHGALVDAAKRCNPDIDVEQCTQSIVIGLACSCPSFVNPGNAEAIAELESSESEYQESECSSGVVCGACLEPVRGVCSSAGVCEDVPPQ